MALPGLRALKQLMRRGSGQESPPASWSRPFGLGWDKPYTVRYASNLDDGPWHGAPLGGFGAGCLGRSSRGDFNLWHLDGGEHWFGPIPDCQFALFEDNGQGPKAHALATAPEAQEASSKPLSSWQWYPASTAEKSTGSYSARYPLSWFNYSNVFKAQVECESFSPILPGNYRDTSLPLAVFRWRFKNPSRKPLKLSLMLSWRNTVGWFTNTDPSAAVTFRDDGSPEHNYLPAIGRTQGQRNRWLDQSGLRGLLMEGETSSPVAEGQGQWCMAVPEHLPGVELMRCSRWNPSGDGKEIWASFSQDGSIPNSNNDRRSGADDPLAGAIALRFTLAPGAELELPVVISWDLPVTSFATGCRDLRRYTDFFGTDGSNAAAIAAEGLGQWPQWRQQIDQWQAPVLARHDLPEPLRMALFNELYDLASGGSLWTAASSADPQGRFGILECLDYAWYESLDVRLYGSFALLQLWPALDRAVLRSFARAIPAADPSPRPIGWYFTQGKGRVEAARKLAGATPHDLGAPNERPFDATNYTAYQDCNLWKDLASDFVLQVWRTYQLA
ncbi:MAG: bile acid beta-glucosidase, partial [Synechococcaceae bacterium WB6_3B_236]|nr:bile acid beta-glucosidase [Synechococcaceae bacterium WB6_3B_236]